MIRFNCNFYFAKVYIYFLIAPLFLCFYINIWAISTLLHIDLYKIVKGRGWFCVAEGGESCCNLSVRSRLLYTSPTANVYRSKEHGYHKCTRIGHSRILIPITFGFKSAFGAILKDFGRYASLVGVRKL